MTIAADAAAADALARQKARATALVAVCVLVYMAAKALERRHAGLAYVAAFAEAAIIGGLADWFAVAALFRHPFGLKLPHTAIIPTNRTRIAEALGDFIARHFLVGPRVGEKVFELDPAASAGRWLAEPGNRRTIATHAARLVPDALAAIDQDTLRDEIERGVLERLAAVDLGKVIGTSLEVMTRDRRHHVLLDDILQRLEARLADPEAIDAIREQIRSELPTLFRFFLADAYLLQRLVRASHGLLTDVRGDPLHPLRSEFDRLIADFIANVRSSPEHRDKVEALKRELLARAELREILSEVWERLLASLRKDVAREHGIIRSGLEKFLADMSERLRQDRRLQLRLNRWLAGAAAAMTERYRQEIGGFVAAQVKTWDTQHAVRTMELSIGKDLQYIRINGTLVGGLLGLAIFTATRMALP